MPRRFTLNIDLTSSVNAPLESLVVKIIYALSKFVSGALSKGFSFSYLRSLVGHVQATCATDEEAYKCLIVVS
jgi:hypothetical protein